MNKLIKQLFKCATQRIITNPLLTNIIIGIEEAINKRDLTLDHKSGELWQQLQDFRNDIK